MNYKFQVPIYNGPDVTASVGRRRGWGKEGEGAANSRRERRCRLDVAFCNDLLGLNFTNQTLCCYNAYLLIYLNT